MSICILDKLILLFLCYYFYAWVLYITHTQKAMSTNDQDETNVWINKCDVSKEKWIEKLKKYLLAIEIEGSQIVYWKKKTNKK